MNLFKYQCESVLRTSKTITTSKRSLDTFIKEINLIYYIHSFKSFLINIKNLSEAIIVSIDKFK